MAGATNGNQNGRKRNRLLSDALKRELTQKPEDLLAIVLKLIEDAKSGDHGARTLLFERVDGKVPQALVGDDEEAPISFDERLMLFLEAAKPGAADAPKT